VSSPTIGDADHRRELPEYESLGRSRIVQIRYPGWVTVR
jgi:hypothetical protein